MTARPERPGRRARRLAVLHAKAAGCTCRPSTRLGRATDGELVVRLGHDSGCPRLGELRGLLGVEALPFDVLALRSEGWRP
jgi:hypothetical protein